MAKNSFPPPIPWELSLKQSKNKKNNLAIGVLALQGDFLEHVLSLQRLGINAIEVRLPKDLAKINGLIMPGGESTTMANLLDTFKMREPLIKKIKEGTPVWGTCAGMILLSKKIVQDRPIPLGVMDIEVNRNAFGRQVESFSTMLNIKQLGNKPIHATFIRAPWIVNHGPEVEILAKLPDETIVAARQRNMLATSFHPELTGDTRIHEYFIKMIKPK